MLFLTPDITKWYIFITMSIIVIGKKKLFEKIKKRAKKKVSKHEFSNRNFFLISAAMRFIINNKKNMKTYLYNIVLFLERTKVERALPQCRRHRLHSGRFVGSQRRRCQGRTDCQMCDSR